MKVRFNGSNDLIKKLVDMFPQSVRIYRNNDGLTSRIYLDLDDRIFDEMLNSCSIQKDGEFYLKLPFQD